jgi:hypothetical protein
MIDSQVKETSPEPKPRLLAGVDVGSEELVLTIRKNGKPFDFKATHSGSLIIAVITYNL